MALEFDVYAPEMIFRTRTSKKYHPRTIQFDKSRAMDRLAMERANRDTVIRWYSATEKPYNLPRNHPQNVLFETDEMHRAAGMIVLSEMGVTMPYYFSIVSLDRTKNIWYWHDDGEVHAGGMCRNGFDFLLLENFVNPFRFPAEQEVWEPFVVDMAQKRGRDKTVDYTILSDHELVLQTYQLFSLFNRTYIEFKDFLPETIPPGVDPYEAANLANFNFMILQAGSFYDWLDIHSDPKNPKTFLDKQEVKRVKEMFYYMQLMNTSNRARLWYEQCGPFDTFEKIVYESYDYFGHLDELAEKEDWSNEGSKKKKKHWTQIMLDEETNYKLKMLHFWYTVPMSLEGLTAKWLDKYVGLMAAIHGPFDWRGHGYSEPPQEIFDHVGDSLKHVCLYYKVIREMLSRDPLHAERNALAAGELACKTAELIELYTDAGFTNIKPLLQEFFPELITIGTKMRNYNVYSVGRSINPSAEIKVQPQEFNYQDSKLPKRMERRAA